MWTDLILFCILFYYLMHSTGWFTEITVDLIPVVFFLDHPAIN